MKNYKFAVVSALSFALIFIQATSHAQVRVGGNFDINFNNERVKTASGGISNNENTFQIVLKPNIYWNLNDKMRVGGRIGFAYGNITMGLGGSDVQALDVEKAYGWSLAPYFSYSLFQWKIVDICLEANAYFGQYYNLGHPLTPKDGWDNQLYFGLKIIPVIDIALTDKHALQVHVGVLSLGWDGSFSRYCDGSEVFDSYVVLAKGGLSNILRSIADFGIGVVRKF